MQIKISNHVGARESHRYRTANAAFSHMARTRSERIGLLEDKRQSEEQQQVDTRAHHELRSTASAR
jgi:hypothetical protein